MTQKHGCWEDCPFWRHGRTGLTTWSGGAGRLWDDSAGMEHLLQAARRGPEPAHMIEGDVQQMADVARLWLGRTPSSSCWALAVISVLPQWCLRVPGTLWGPKGPWHEPWPSSCRTHAGCPQDCRIWPMTTVGCTRYCRNWAGGSWLWCYHMSENSCWMGPPLSDPGWMRALKVISKHELAHFRLCWLTANEHNGNSPC